MAWGKDKKNDKDKDKKNDENNNPTPKSGPAKDTVEEEKKEKREADEKRRAAKRAEAAKKDRCSICAFSKFKEGRTKGSCFRNPPTGSGGLTVTVPASHYCGEFVTK